MTDPGVTRRTSEHFASEFGSGLSVQALLERAGVLASANDLWPAAAQVVQGLVPLRRGLTRVIHRPIGLSGSGPTLWALYPSLEEASAAADVVRRAIAAGDLAIPGDGDPFVTATTIETGRSDA
jgi:4-diphosphocytidyl-2C-methyl-D-erythritol kinase